VDEAAITAKIKRGPQVRVVTLMTIVATILSWSRSQGPFAGVALEGATRTRIWKTTRRNMERKWKTSTS
jgi:lipid-binding SYLF domain-containing protein